SPAREAAQPRIHFGYRSGCQPAVADSLRNLRFEEWRLLETAMGEITQLLVQARNGDGRARDALFTSTYGELCKLARTRLRDGSRNAALESTWLVHEAYLRVVRAGDLRATERRGFFAYLSRVMRSVIVDSAREGLAQRRGGNVALITLSMEVVDELPCAEEDLVRVHDALEMLEQADARLAKIVEMRYFGGYTQSEIAASLHVGRRTVQREWEKARLFLIAALRR